MCILGLCLDQRKGLAIAIFAITGLLIFFFLAQMML